MSAQYIFQNEKLKCSFKNIIAIKREIGNTKNNVNVKLGELKKLHSEMIRDNNKQIFSIYDNCSRSIMDTYLINKNKGKKNIYENGIHQKL